jgi:hypothetical protein
MWRGHLTLWECFLSQRSRHLTREVHFLLQMLVVLLFSLQHSIQFSVPIQWMVHWWVLVHCVPVKGHNMSALSLEVSKTWLTHNFVHQNFQVYHGAFQVVPTTSLCLHLMFYHSFGIIIFNNFSSKTNPETSAGTTTCLEYRLKFRNKLSKCYFFPSSWFLK